MTTLDSNPFFFEGNEIGCLLIHGLSGTPLAMRQMGQYLAGKGLTVLGVRLAGHGTTPEEMAQTRWPDWVASAADGLAELKSICAQVFIVGFSLGGLIALHLGTRNRVGGLIIMSTPVYIKNWRARFLPLLKYIRKYRRDDGKSDLTDPEARIYVKPYEKTPLICYESLFQFQAMVRGELPRIEVPILIMQGTHDRAIPLTNAQYIYDHIGSQDRELVWFHNSGHGIVVDSEKEEVWRRAYEFIRDHVIH